MSKVTGRMGAWTDDDTREAAIEVLANLPRIDVVIEVLREALDEVDLAEIGEAFHIE